MSRFGRNSASQKVKERLSRVLSAGDSTGLQLTPSFYLVTPTRVTLFSGTEDLVKMWHDPKLHVIPGATPASVPIEIYQVVGRLRHLALDGR